LISPRKGHEKGSLVPYSTNVIPEIPRCRNVIVGRGYRHLHYFSDL